MVKKSTASTLLAKLRNNERDYTKNERRDGCDYRTAGGAHA